MTFTLQQLTKDIANIDFEDILSCWQWKLTEMKSVAMISCFGDMFLVGNDDAIYWLQTDSGDLTKVAENLTQFELLLRDDNKIDYWFLPLLVEKLLNAGKTLEENEVYGYLKLPVIGGEYSIENIKVIPMRVHFEYTGLICEQIKDLPDGTKVSIELKR
jgi:hypothetical protein